MREELLDVYKNLYEEYGSQNWWPGEGLEIAIGAILTQQTNWKNVEKALLQLRKAHCLNMECLQKISIEELEKLIKSSGFYRIKARRIKNLIEILSINPQPDRKTLLAINGLGYETADSIMLYLFEKKYFVIDSYTFRIMNRLGLYNGKNYLELQRLFMKNLPSKLQLYQEYHALIVKHAKSQCIKSNPQCVNCALNKRCQYGIEQNKKSMER
jgi:endonuclease-3 related protein